MALIVTGWSFYPAKKVGKIITQKPILHEPDRQNIRELWTDLIVAIESKLRAVCDIETGPPSANLSLLGMRSEPVLGEWNPPLPFVSNMPEALKLRWIVP